MYTDIRVTFLLGKRNKKSCVHACKSVYIYIGIKKAKEIKTKLEEHRICSSLSWILSLGPFRTSPRFPFTSHNSCPPL